MSTKIDDIIVVNHNERSGIAKELADRWFQKYLKIGFVTEELEQERYEIVKFMLQQRQK